MAKHKSFFSYTLKRYYPYRWFTPVLTIGGIIFFVIFSIINVAAQGYDLRPTVSINPNETISRKDWLSSWPSSLVGARTNCEDAIIPLRARVITNKAAIPYTLSGIWKLDEKKNNTPVQLGSLVYHNQPLEGCHIKAINLELKTETRMPSQLATIPVGVATYPKAECSFYNGEYRVFLQLTGDFEVIFAPSENIRNEVHSSPSVQAYIYFGWYMMRQYWTASMWRFAASNNERDNDLINGWIEVKLPEWKQNYTEEDIIDKDFLDHNCWFNRRKYLGIKVSRRVCGDFRRNMTTFAKEDLEPKMEDLPDLDFWEALTKYAKATYFTVLADLGRDDASMPNLLSRPSLLGTFLQKLESDMKSLEEIYKKQDVTDFNIEKGPESPFDPKVDFTIPPSQLVAVYQCKIRAPKSALSLIIAVLVANIVFVSSLYGLYVWVVDTFWLREEATLPQCACYDPDAMDSRTAAEESVPLKSVRKHSLEVITRVT